MTPRTKGEDACHQSQLSPGDPCPVSPCKSTSHRSRPKVPLRAMTQPLSSYSANPNWSSKGLPMPTCASRIILTSFAPSPIAKVIGCSFENLINLTIWKRKEKNVEFIFSVWISLGLLTGQKQRHKAGVGHRILSAYSSFTALTLFPPYGITSPHNN